MKQGQYDGSIRLSDEIEEMVQDNVRLDSTENSDAADRGVVIAAGKEDVRKWFIAGVEQGRRYMLVIYDRMEILDDSDQPYYCDDAEAVYKLLSAIRRDPMCEVMEVYDLSADREVQLGERRAWHLPANWSFRTCRRLRMNRSFRTCRKRSRHQGWKRNRNQGQHPASFALIHSSTKTSV